MTVRASDIAKPRDDSLAGVARRAGVWVTVGLALWLVPMVGVQIGAVLEERSVELFGPRALVETAGRLLQEFGAEPWWRALPEPAAGPHRVTDLLVGTLFAFAAYVVVTGWLWRLGLARTGQLEGSSACAAAGRCDVGSPRRGP